MFEDSAPEMRIDHAGLLAVIEYVRDGDVLVNWKLAPRVAHGMAFSFESVRMTEVRKPQWLPRCSGSRVLLSGTVRTTRSAGR